MSDLGTLYHVQGKDELAEPLLTKALEARRRVLGPNPDTWDTLGALAEVELQKKKYVDVEPLLGRRHNWKNKPRHVEPILLFWEPA